MRRPLRDFPYRGTISHGTLRTQDLIETFMQVLRELSPDSVTPEVADQERRALNACDGTYDNDPAYSAEDVAREQDAASEFLTWVMDELDALAPEGIRFGAHEGDGSDFGFWLVDDEAPHIGHYSHLGGQ